MQKPTYCFVSFLLATVGSNHVLGYVYERGTGPLASISIPKPGFANSSVVTVSVGRCKLEQYKKWGPLPLRPEGDLLTLKHKRMCEIEPVYSTNFSSVYLFSLVKSSFKCILVK